MVVSSTSMNVGMTTVRAMIQGLIARRWIRPGENAMLLRLGESAMLLMMPAPSLHPYPSPQGEGVRDQRVNVCALRGFAELRRMVARPVRRWGPWAGPCSGRKV